MSRLSILHKRSIVHTFLILLTSLMSATTFAAGMAAPDGIEKRLIAECEGASYTRNYLLMKEKGKQLHQHGSSIGSLSASSVGEAYLINALVMLHDTTDLSSSSQHLDLNLSKLEKENNWEAVAVVANALSKYHHFIRSDYSRASAYAFKSLDAAKKTDNIKEEVNALSLLAAIYFYKKDQSGWKYALEAYDIAKANSFLPALYFTSSNLANYLLKDGKIDEALKYLQESDEVAEKLHYDEERCYILSFYAQLYADSGENAKADEDFRQSISDSTGGSVYDKIYARMLYAAFLSESGQTARALELLEETNGMATKENVLNFQLQIYDLMTRILESQGNFRDALKYQKLYDQVNNEINSRDREREFTILDLRYKVTQAELENYEKDLELTRRSRTIIAVTAVTLLLALSVLFIFIYHRHRMANYRTIVANQLESLENERLLREQLENAAASRSEIKANAGLTDSRKSELFDMVEKMMANDKIYRQQDLSLDKVAAMAGTNRTYLSQVINECFGNSFSMYVNSYRLKEALELLSDTENDEPLKNIGFAVGFTSPSNFYTLFRQKIGVSPSLYRSNVRNIKALRPTT